MPVIREVRFRKPIPSDVLDVALEHYLGFPFVENLAGYRPAPLMAHVPPHQVRQFLVEIPNRTMRELLECICDDSERVVGMVGKNSDAMRKMLDNMVRSRGGTSYARSVDDDLDPDDTPLELVDFKPPSSLEDGAAKVVRSIRGKGLVPIVIATIGTLSEAGRALDAENILWDTAVEVHGPDNKPSENIRFNLGDEHMATYFAAQGHLVIVREPDPLFGHRIVTGTYKIVLQRHDDVVFALPQDPTVPYRTRDGILRQEAALAGLETPVSMPAVGKQGPAAEMVPAVEKRDPAAEIASLKAELAAAKARADRNQAAKDAHDAATLARDEIGFVGSVAECIRFLDSELQEARKSQPEDPSVHGPARPSF